MHEAFINHQTHLLVAPLDRALALGQVINDIFCNLLITLIPFPCDTYIYRYLNKYKYVYVCTYIYIYIHTHTCIYIYI